MRTTLSDTTSLSQTLANVVAHAAALDETQSATLAKALLKRFGLTNAAAEESLRLAAIQQRTRLWAC